MTKHLIRKHDLDRDRNPQVFAIGVKEVWDVPKETRTGGRVIHTMGWPLRNEEFGGGFIYNMAGGRVSIGSSSGWIISIRVSILISAFRNSRGITI